MSMNNINNNNNDGLLQHQRINDTNGLTKKQQKQMQKAMKKELKKLKRNAKKAKNADIKAPKNIEKIKFRINKVLMLCEQKKLYHQNEMEKMIRKQTELQNLLINSDNMSFKDIKSKMMEIVKKHKAQKKFKGNKLIKSQNKADKMQRKEERKQQRLQRKAAKMAKIKKLENARIDDLPVMNNGECLIINIDGHNIMGCDGICRKQLRKRGQKRAKQRLCSLVYDFMEQIKGNISYDIKVNVWFDGYGKQYQYNDAFPVQFSGKNVTVDDVLVESYQNSQNTNGNVLVVTSDRELTLRLFDCGVKVIKSGVFYKKYLKKNDDNGNDVIDVGVTDVVMTDDTKENYNNNNNNNNADEVDDDIPYDNLRLAKVDEHGNDKDTDEPGADNNDDDDDDDDMDDDDDAKDDDLYDETPGGIDSHE